MLETTIRTDKEVITISKEHYTEAIFNKCRIAQIERIITEEYQNTNPDSRKYASIDIKKIADILDINLDDRFVDLPNIF